MRRFSLLALIAIACAGLAACHADGLQSAEGNLGFDPPELDVGHTWSGATIEKTVRVSNLGRSPVTIEWAHPGLPFELVNVPDRLEGGASATLTVRFHAGEPGNDSGTARAHTNAGRDATLKLAATSDAIPQCPTPVACHTVAFDLTLGQCVETARPDGVTCDPHSVCVLNATCQAGSCVGTPVVCDDGNACTLDVCNAVTGCEFPPAPPCPGDGKCQNGVCDPKLGCTFATAPDGTVCGALTCDAAQICVSGACVWRDPPDGFVCAEASPCQEEGLCSGSQCVRGPPVQLVPSWSLQPQVDADGGIIGPRLHDMVMEPSGDLSLFGFYETPRLRENGANPVELPTAPRRCIGWNGGIVCADYGPNATLTSIAFDGQERWSFNLGVARPDVLQDNDNVFMARVASMGTDRLLGVFETYPKNADGQCRGYYLVALDPQGSLVWMQHLNDPFLTDFSTCQHPHPYGVAVDAQGNIYLAFSNSFLNPQAAIPLAPQSPTLLMSFTANGLPRWSRTENFVGGELAVADGLLFEENAQYPFDSTTGESVALNKNIDRREFVGRPVVTPNRYVTSPSDAVGVHALHGYDLNADPVWTFALPDGDSFLSRELQLVTWQAKPTRPVFSAVLAFAQRGGEEQLVAVKANDGAELWSCPLYLGDAPPQTIAVANGSFALMTNAETCGECDPPFANSTASFWQYTAPGLKPSTDPWPGTYAGPLHDHVEKSAPIVLPVVPSN